MYLIKVSTNDHYEGEVLMLRAQDPTPLTTHHFLKERLAPPKVAAHYVFHSTASFEVTVNLLSGQVHIEITDPEGRPVHSKQIINTDTLKVEMDTKLSAPVDEFYSREAEYHIRATTGHEANYHIQVNRQQPTIRLFEGYPSRFTLQPEKTVAVEFYNSNKSGINLMIMSQFGEAPNLDVKYGGRDSDGYQVVPHAIKVVEYNESGGSCLAKIASNATVYSIQLTNPNSLN